MAWPRFHTSPLHVAKTQADERSESTQWLGYHVRPFGSLPHPNNVGAINLTLGRQRSGRGPRVPRSSPLGKTLSGLVAATARVRFLRALGLSLLLLSPAAGAAHLRSDAALEIPAGRVTLFTAPESSYAALRHVVDGARSSLAIASYVASGAHILAPLCEAAGRGVEVTVLLDGSPVGGLRDDGRAFIEEALASGIRVVLTGGSEPFAFSSMHAKFIVADSRRTLLVSENFGTSGFPPPGVEGNRGWGAIVDDEAVAATFSRIFDLDAGGSSGGVRVLDPSGAWRDCRMVDPPEGAVASLTTSAGVELHFSPDPAVLSRLRSLSRDSSWSISAQELQVPPRWKGGPNQALESLVEAAESGTVVRLHMDSKYADADPDSNLATYAELSLRRQSNLEARLSIPPGLLKVHNKGIIFDSEVVWLGSANFGEASYRRNREAVVVLHSSEAAAYFGRFFDADWGDGGDADPPRPAAVAFVTVGLAASLLSIFSSLSDALSYRKRHK